MPAGPGSGAERASGITRAGFAGGTTAASGVAAEPCALAAALSNAAIGGPFNEAVFAGCCSLDPITGLNKRDHVLCAALPGAGAVREMTAGCGGPLVAIAISVLVALPAATIRVEAAVSG